MPTLTPEAKQLLATTIRSLRDRLLRDIRAEAERRYRLSVTLRQAGLNEAHRRRRERLEAWLDERVRGAKPKKGTENDVRARLLDQAIKEAAATLLNRLILVRHLEALGLSKPLVVTGGWNSKGYREFREFAPALAGDETEGYHTLLQILFDELALDLPGLFGDVGLTRLFVIPASTLREIVERLDDPKLASAWTDDTTLGWVYQYWNDPEREALDAKINAGGKIEPHEIASKTQMFTERYMVEWLLQNSLGLTWLCICQKNGWRADARDVLPVLEARRVDWRAKRDAGHVTLDALMPLDGELEDHWKYFVEQPIPEDAVKNAPRSIRDLKLLDPACGSGHFLVIAFDMLAALYREEARHTGVVWTAREIAESILENNVFGIDIDARAIQIAAAGLYAKARVLAKDVRPKRVNLVAPVLELAKLSEDDPALVVLRRDLKKEAGLSEKVVNELVKALKGVDHLGSLLRVDDAVEQAIETAEREFEGGSAQGNLFGQAFAPQQVKLPLGPKTKATTLDKIEQFLAQHSRAGDLGLRLEAEQLAAGVRFVRMVHEGTYDIVVGNPPYQGTSRMADAGYVAKTYPRGKADLYAAFLERGLQLVRPGGLSGLLTMRGWMFLGQFAEMRKYLLGKYDLTALVDIDSGGFEEVSAAQVVLSVAASMFRNGKSDETAFAIRPTPREDRVSTNMTARKRAGLLAHVGRYDFDPKGFGVIEGEPIVYWWTKEFLERYESVPKLGELAAVRQGLATSANACFLRRPWEVRLKQISYAEDDPHYRSAWAPYIKGGAGGVWMEPLDDIVNWTMSGLSVKAYAQHLYGSYTRTIKNEEWYFKRGVCFTKIGSRFDGRAHRYPSVIDVAGSSVYPEDIPTTLTLLNSSMARFVLSSLNPTINFQVGDVNRLPVFPIQGADQIYATIESAFTVHESTREPSIEFKQPGPSPWAYAQAWAQRAVDRPEDAPLPPYEAEYENPPPEAFVSFALGVALGRFGANGEGLLDAAPDSSLPHGILFVSGAGGNDSLQHPACSLLHNAYATHGGKVGAKYENLGDYLRRGFFPEYHKALYENRPIYFPLSSTKKNFVAWISIHRWSPETLSVLLAEHLMPEKRRLEGELADLLQARADKTAKSKAEKRYADAQKMLEELVEFVDKVNTIAYQGPLPTDDKCLKREVDARFVMDLDDGVMVNASALWSLLEPQWKDPKKWWKELATAQGRKDYDWSHVAMRYFPSRVAKKCTEDPSLAVAHGCFWRLWPEKAYAWELRLQDEIRPEFTIDEAESNAAREAFLATNVKLAAEIRATEMKRRERKKEKADEPAEDMPLYEGIEQEDEG